MNLQSYDPWNALLRLQEEIERAYGQPQGLAQGLSGRGAFPPVNVFRGQAGYVARFEVPGMGPGDLTIESRGQTLVVSGKRARRDPGEGSIHRRETWSGEFSRSLGLPEDADLAGAEAEVRDGILTVRIPYREETRPRRITVSSH